MIIPRRAGTNGKDRRLSPYIFLPLKLTPCRNLLAIDLNWMPRKISSVLKYLTSRIHTLAYHQSDCSRVWRSVGIEYSTAPNCLFEYVYSQHHIRQQHKVLAPASTPEKNSAFSERHLIPFPLITAIIWRSVLLRKFSLSPFTYQRSGSTSWTFIPRNLLFDHPGNFSTLLSPSSSIIFQRNFNPVLNPKVAPELIRFCLCCPFPSFHT